MNKLIQRTSVITLDISKSKDLVFGIRDGNQDLSTAFSDHIPAHACPSQFIGGLSCWAWSTPQIDLNALQNYGNKGILDPMFKVVFKQFCSKEQIAPQGLAQTEASVHTVGPRYHRVILKKVSSGIFSIILVAKGEKNSTWNSQDKGLSLSKFS